MRLRKQSTDADKRATRGLGPFSGAQLTVVIVAIAAIFAIPTAALAASGAFSSKTAAPAVVATSTAGGSGAVAVLGNQRGGGGNVRFGVKGKADGNGGVGVQGNGAKYGVYSAGNLGVKNGSSLSCSGCVGQDALSKDARTNLLRSGESESGVFVAAGGDSTTGYAGTGATYARQPADAIANFNREYTTVGTPTPHCSGEGTAAPGWMCLYQHQINNMTFNGLTQTKFGAVIYFTVTGNPGYADGTWTITAA